SALHAWRRIRRSAGIAALQPPAGPTRRPDSCIRAPQASEQLRPVAVETLSDFSGSDEVPTPLLEFLNCVAGAGNGGALLRCRAASSFVARLERWTGSLRRRLGQRSCCCVMNWRIVDAPRVGAAATPLARCPPKDRRSPW